MDIVRFRWSVQIMSFFILLYGAYVGIHVGLFLPTFSCCFVDSRTATCFMLNLQDGLGMFTPRSMGILLENILIFSVMVIIAGRAWCGWICPMGFLQDVMDYLRVKSSIGFVRFSDRVQRKLRWCKWIFLSIAVLFPLWVAFPFFCPAASSGFDIAFCRICPGRFFFSLLSGNTGRIAFDPRSVSSMILTILGLAISMIVFVGSFVKRRFWCAFCPLGLIMSWYRKIAFFKLKKDDSKCTKCEICYNVCPLDIEEIYKTSGKIDVTFPDCILCLKCIEKCPEERALYATFLGKTIYKSSSDKFFKSSSLCKTACRGGCNE